METAAVAGVAKLSNNRMETSRRVGTYDRVMFGYPLVTKREYFACCHIMQLLRWRGFDEFPGIQSAFQDFRLV